MSKKANDNRAKPEDFQRLIDEIEGLWKQLMEVRSVFPRFDATAVGSDRVDTPEFYAAQGYPAVIHLGRPSTTKDIERQNRIAHWVNESFVVRMHTLLEHAEKQKTSSDEIKSSEEVKFLKKLRNLVAHGHPRPGERHRKDTDNTVNTLNDQAQKVINWDDAARFVTTPSGGKPEPCLDIDRVLSILKCRILNLIEKAIGKSRGNSESRKKSDEEQSPLSPPSPSG